MVPSCQLNPLGETQWTPEGAASESSEGLLINRILPRCEAAAPTESTAQQRPEVRYH